MAMVFCSACSRETLNTEGKCQFCGQPLKFSIWKRKLRRNEAYGILLIITGAALLMASKAIGLILVFGGVAWIVSGLIRPRVRW
jgi:hypothetical protein